MVVATTAKAAVGSENQLIVRSARPRDRKIQFMSPKDESKIQAKMTTAITSGTAQGMATIIRAILRPRKRLSTSSAVPRPSRKHDAVTTIVSLSVTQHAFQKSGDANSRS